MSNFYLILQFIFGITMGIVIGCSPTKFNPAQSISDICKDDVKTCVVENGYINLTQNFEVGTGKVDILFVNDNSASMSTIQFKLKERFSGFIQNLDNKKVNYRIAVTTTDLNTVNTQKLIPMSNGRSYLSNSDNERINLFYSSIIRNETLVCETFIKSMFLTYGTVFQSQSSYSSQYLLKCPNPDTRGIYSANTVVADKSSSFIRPDANLNIILISNDEVRQGRFKLAASDPRYLPLEDLDKAESLAATIESNYPLKYWDFNSIIVKDLNCQASQNLKTNQGVTIVDQFGNPSISGAIGYEYAKISNSAAKDIDNNPRPRGKILDICQNDYAQHFLDMETQITESSRMFNLKCSPKSEPIVTDSSGTVVSQSIYSWNADKVIFKKGTEGSQFSVQYKCLNGAK